MESNGRDAKVAVDPEETIYTKCPICLKDAKVADVQLLREQISMHCEVKHRDDKD